MRATALVVGLIATAGLTQEPGSEAKLRVLVVTGGHDFEREPLVAMFDSFEGLEWREAEHPNANDLYTPEAAAAYDVLVLYDMNQEITDEQKAEFLSMLERGKGLVILHHALADYQGWEEFEHLRGGTYLLAPGERGGKELPGSTFRHGVDINVRVLLSDHPVTRGLEDFTIHDEVYGLTYVEQTVTPLLATDHPESGATVAWTSDYGNSRIVTIQLGHDHFAYEDANYRRLVSQAMHWVKEPME